MSDELLDPCPDPHALFLHYAPLYFDNALDRACVQWSSKRMTRQAFVLLVPALDNRSVRRA